VASGYDRKDATERNGGGVAGTAMLASLLLGFAPVALFGGSSTSMMLCLAAVAGLAAVALWELVIPRQALALAPYLVSDAVFLR